MTSTDVRALAGPVNATYQIADVRLIDISAHGEEYDGSLLDAQSEVGVNTVRRDDAVIEVRARYSVRAWAADEAEPERDHEGDATVWTCVAEIGAVFAPLPGRERDATQLDDANLNAFGFSTGIMAIHPFARELLQSTVSRLGFPPYTLPFMRAPWESDERASWVTDAEDRTSAEHERH